MSDTSAPDVAGGDPEKLEGSGGETLWQRLLYMLGFWFLGNVAFSLAIFLGVVQFVVILLRGEKNEDLRGFSRNLIQYVWEALAFVVFVQDEKPFPFGKFPSVKVDE